MIMESISTRVRFPWAGMSLKSHLLYEFNAIQNLWAASPYEKEDKAETMADKIKWTVVRHHFQIAVKQMRRMQRKEDRKYYHLSLYYDPIEAIHAKFSDLWVHHLKMHELDISDDNQKFKKLWYTLLVIWKYLNAINADLEIEDEVI